MTQKNEEILEDPLQEIIDAALEEKKKKDLLRKE